MTVNTGRMVSHTRIVEVSDEQYHGNNRQDTGESANMKKMLYIDHAPVQVMIYFAHARKTY